VNEKRFRRSSRDKVLGGVIGGLADYLGVDSNLLRVVIIILLTLTEFSSTLIVTYFLIWLFIPEDKERLPSNKRVVIKEKEVLRIFAWIMIIIGSAVLISILSDTTQYLSIFITPIIKTYLSLGINIREVLKAILALALIFIGYRILTKRDEKLHV